MKKRRLKYKNIAIALIILLLILFGAKTLLIKEIKMQNFENKNIKDVELFAKQNNFKLEIVEKYNNTIPKGYVISQNIKENTKIKKEDILKITVSLGEKGSKYYGKYKVDESGNIPIMMYHGIHNLKNNETGYVGGNIDKDGYQRTAEAFRNDLEFFYKNNYRMIRLNDYIDGIIDVEVGKSPIVLTFDDGLKNNILVTGLDDDGNIIIDPNSAVGIMEEYKKKYPNFNITATFFLNAGLFHQEKYNQKIINWLLNNGYDIGNHSYSHLDITNLSSKKTEEEIGKMYNLLSKYTNNKFVNIVALPFGSPYDEKHKNFPFIMGGDYNNVEYKTKSTLRVGWESELSPFHKNFNSTFLKRIRAYDNLGNDYDIEHNFKMLEKNKYISDGDKTTIVIPKGKINLINQNNNLKVIEY